MRVKVGCDLFGEACLPSRNFIPCAAFLRSTSAVTSRRIAGFHATLLSVLQLRETGVYATARILNVNDRSVVVAFINDTGLIQTPLYIRAAKKHGLRTFI